MWERTEMWENLLSKREYEQAVRTDRGGYMRGEMCLNRMWAVEKLQESWIFSTYSLLSLTLNHGINCKTQKENTQISNRKFDW